MALGLKDLCVLLATSAVTIPSTAVVVQKRAVQERQAQQTKPKAKSHKPAKSKPVATRPNPEPRQREVVCIIDMPSIGMPVDLEPVSFEDLGGKPGGGFWSWLPPVTWWPIDNGGGGGSTPAPGIPESQTWAYLVFGFGFIGASARWKRKVKA